MSIEGEKVRFALKRALESINPKFSKACIVRSVSADPITGLMICDCESIEDKSVLEDVRLVADFKDTATKTGLVLVPKVGSIVLVSFLNNAEYFVAMCSEVDSIFLNGNNYGGLVKVVQLTAKINALENLVNDLITKYNTHTHLLTLSAGSGTAAPTISLETGTIAPITQRSDIENTTVKQGNGGLIP